MILYGASISTSSRLGLGKEENYAYEIYEIEFVPEVLFSATYRKSLTSVFPRFLKVMAKYHEEEICSFLQDALGYKRNVADSADRLVTLFSEMGVDMYFDGAVSEQDVTDINIETTLSTAEVTAIMKECMRK